MIALRLFKKYWVFLTVVVISIILSTGIWLGGKFTITYMFRKDFNISWKDFVYTLPVGLIISIVILIKLRPSKNSSTLATSKWMSSKIFKKIFNHYNWTSESPKSGFLVETKINGSNFDYSSTKDVGHSLVIGSTRSGKTSRLANPNIQTLAKAGANMIISDPKGELFNTHSRSLEEQGYEVLSLNLRNYALSSKWNPLTKIWNLWHHETDDEHIKELKIDEALGSLAELSAILFPSSPRDNPIWTQGASTIFQFMVIGLLEYSEFDDKITKEHFNISNILANLNVSTYEHLTEFADLLQELAKSSGKPMSKALMIGGRNIRGAEDTTAGMISNAITALSIYGDATVKRITAENEITISDEKKQVVFLIVPDEDKSKNAFVSLFVSETYKELISKAASRPDGQLKRPFYYILDEFGNIPKIPNMDAMVTVSASRNIFFMIIVQNLQQIDSIYGREISSTIRNNCAYQFYLMTADLATAESISKMIGEYEIEQTSHSSSSNPNTNGSSSTSTSKRTRRLLDANELMKIKIGEVIVLTIRNEPIQSFLAPFWEFKEFTTGPMKLEEKKMVNFEKKYIYKFIDTEDDEDEGSGQVLEPEKEDEEFEEVKIKKDHKIDL